ncbi:MAG TPA: potassium/proton antiporter [Egibacteraceae bacterium]|nr:potassium/proton antiporter [Egibacteraceae bacterium]
MQTPVDVDPVVLIAAALLAAGVLVAWVTRWVRVPGSLLFLALGMLVADDGLGLVRFDDPTMAGNLGVLALIVILFEGGLTTKPSDLRRAAAPGIALATAGVAITAGVTAGVVHLLLGVDLLTAALVGAVVASTDAAAVFDLLRKAPLPPRLAAVLRVESGANDPVAIALTIGLLELWAGTGSPQRVALFALAQLVGGLLVGGAIGYAGAFLLRHVELGTDTLYPVLALATGGLAYGSAAQLGASGFLATFVAGMVVGAFVPRRRRGIQGFHAGLASVADIGLFLVLGLLVFPSRLPGVALSALAVAGALTFIARPLAVLATAAPARDIGWRESLVLGWTGLRGAVPIVLATFPFAVGHPAAQDIFDVVFFVVLVSTLLQGATVTPLVRRLGLAADRPGWAPVAEALPLEGVDVDLVEVSLSSDLPIANQQLQDVPLSHGMTVVTIVRGAHAVIPRGSTRLLPGDLVLLAVEPQAGAAQRATAWARGEVHRKDGHHQQEGGASAPPLSSGRET